MPKPPIQIKVNLETDKFNQMLMTKVIPSARPASETIVRTAVLEIMTRVLKTWPVDTGRSRGAWLAVFDHAQAKLGGPGLSPPQKGNPSAIAEGRAKGLYEERQGVRGFNAKLVNGVDYAPSLEGGSSTQAPTGSLRNAMSSMRREIGKSPMVKKFVKGLKGVRHTL